MAETERRCLRRSILGRLRSPALQTRTMFTQSNAWESSRASLSLSLCVYGHSNRTAHTTSFQPLFRSVGRQSAVEMDPSMADAWSNLGSAFHAEDDLEDALGWCVHQHIFLSHPGPRTPNKKHDVRGA